MTLFYVYLFVLELCFISGIYNYKYFSSGFKIILTLICLTFNEEALNLVIGLSHGKKAPVYHIYSILEIYLTSLYFLKTIEIQYFKKWAIISFVFWVAIGVGNIIFLQPITKINSNMLIVESIAIIAMSLYALYTMFLNESIPHILKYPDFWIWVVFLLLWSGSYYFWGFLKALSKTHLIKFGNLAYSFQEILNIIVYMGIGLTFMLYPKKGLK